MTYLLYEDLFKYVEKGGLTLPLSCLDNESIIDELIDELIKDIDQIEAISYSSFLNMVVQTCEPKESAQLGRNEISAIGFKKDIPGNKVVFHRDCLLYMVSRIIAGGKDGTMRITGGTDRRGTAKYYKALLLINSKINKAGGNTQHTFLKNYLIRDHPPYYAPEATNTLYQMRLQRYWYIYNRILSTMRGNEARTISNGVKILEEDSGLTLQDHYSVLAMALNWFLILPVENRKEQEISALGFDYRNIGSFYIKKNNFPETDKLICLIESVAKDKNSIQQHFAKNRRDGVSGFFQHFRDFFDHPVFKIDDDSFCILDLKFLIEGLCSGLLWRIRDNASLKNDLQQLKGYYGQLIEKYFVFLLEKIFGQDKVYKTPGQGADVIVETYDYLIIFEFTTEYYRFSSLYNTSTNSFMQDLHRLLFNQGSDDPCNRGKSDKGKFLKLNEYLNTAAENRKKTIIPILVTENYLGDYDLLNQFDNFLDKKIERFGLKNIQQYKPVILCLDDLEIFWALCDEDKAVQELETYIQTWEKSDKGKFLYDFSYFISSDNDIIKNKSYTDFFDYSKFLEELAK